MAFRIGQRVVCVNDAINQCQVPWPIVGDLDGLTKNKTYTVRAIGNWRGFSCIWVEEILRATYRERSGEPGYWVERFRPVIERGTDTGMAILRKLLDGSKIEEKV